MFLYKRKPFLFELCITNINDLKINIEIAFADDWSDQYMNKYKLFRLFVSVQSYHQLAFSLAYAHRSKVKRGISDIKFASGVNQFGDYLGTFLKNGCGS